MASIFRPTLIFLELFLLGEQKKKWIGKENLSSHYNSIKCMENLDSVHFLIFIFTYQQTLFINNRIKTQPQEKYEDIGTSNNYPYIPLLLSRMMMDTTDKQKPINYFKNI